MFSCQHTLEAAILKAGLMSFQFIITQNESSNKYFQQTGKSVCVPPLYVINTAFMKGSLSSRFFFFTRNVLSANNGSHTHIKELELNVLMIYRSTFVFFSDIKYLYSVQSSLQLHDCSTSNQHGQTDDPKQIFKRRLVFQNHPLQMVSIVYCFKISMFIK